MRLAFRSALLCAALALPAAASAQQAPLLGQMFQDHAVLQRDRPISVWGNAPAGEQVSVELDGASASARADANGRWSAQLPARGAGGPYRLVASTQSGRSQAAEDILVGDVWLCSGQSNMEWPVSRALNGQSEAAGANDEGLRLLTVAQNTSAAPLDAFKAPVAWQRTTTASAADFSAVCYFMARELRKSEKVPMGLIDSSWGGTAINPWRSEQAIRAAGDEAVKLDVLIAYRGDPVEGNRRFGETWGQWWRQVTGDAPGSEPWVDGSREGWKDVPNFGPWEQWGDPELAQHNGMVWYATEVRLTPAQARQGATLSIGTPDEIGQTWVNGTPVGNSYGGEANFALPNGVLKAGVNRVVVNVLDTWAQGGLVGADELRRIRFADGSIVPLASGWQYRKETRQLRSPPRAPWESNGGLSTIYNAMIAPMGDYGLKGIAWYQGESDTGAAEGYAVRLSSLMSDWRRQFRAPELPFFAIQLAGFGAAPTRPVESGTATVRDEQRRAIAGDARAGLVVTTDIGDRWDIHPVNKQQVGLRLARAARHVAYGNAQFPSGPMVARAARSGAEVVVTFTDVEGALATISGASATAFELCGTGPGTCRFVDARVSGSEVRIPVADAQPAERVRFCWGDSPVCNLTDASGLPASPFEVPVTR